MRLQEDINRIKEVMGILNEDEITFSYKDKEKMNYVLRRIKTQDLEEIFNNAIDKYKNYLTRFENFRSKFAAEDFVYGVVNQIIHEMDLSNLGLDSYSDSFSREMFILRKILTRIFHDRIVKIYWEL